MQSYQLVIFVIFIVFTDQFLITQPNKILLIILSIVVYLYELQILEIKHSDKTIKILFYCVSNK